MANLIRVECKLSNCAFLVQPADNPGMFCNHADKKHHLIENPCPLYRPDWTKATDQIAALRKRFGLATPR